jgi:hypothetical protein
MRLIIHATGNTPPLHFTDDGSGPVVPGEPHWQRLLDVPALDIELRIEGRTATPTGSALLDNGDGALTNLFASGLLGAGVTVELDNGLFSGAIRAIEIGAVIRLELAA